MYGGHDELARIEQIDGLSRDEVAALLGDESASKEDKVVGLVCCCC